MEKLKNNINFVLLLALIFLSVINFFIYFMDYKFEPISYIWFMLLYVLIAIAVTVVSLKFKDSKTRAAKMSGILMPFVTLVFIVSLGFALELNVIYIQQNLLYFESLFVIGLSSSFVIFFGSVIRKSVKIFMGIIIGVISIPVAFIVFISLIFNNFGETKVIQSLNSSDGTYNAFVVSSDQGALGGNSCLYVRNIKKDIFIGIGTFKTGAQLLKFGEWGGSYDLVWKDEITLVANKIEYNTAYIL